MPRNSTLYTNRPKTFRRSSRAILTEKGKKNVGWGSNLQNIEKLLRSVYISDGYEEHLKNKCKYWLETGDHSVFTEEELLTLKPMAQGDQSGAEALIVAYECTDGPYRQLFINNIKPHVYVGMKLFLDIWGKKAAEHNYNIIDDDVFLLALTTIPKLRLNPKWKDLDSLIKASDNWPTSERYYYFAKQTCHSANYGIEPPKFRMNILEKSGGKVVISKEDSIRFLQTYRAIFPEIPDRNERIRQQVDKSRMLFNLFSHPYTITNYNITENTYKEYYAWSAQSTVAEITRTAYSSLQEYIEEYNKKWDLLADTHDSYLTQGPILDIGERVKKMQEFMNIELTSPIDGTKFRMKSEVQVGFCWAPYYENNPEKCPLGLRELKWLK